MAKKWLVVPLSDVKVATVGNPRKTTRATLLSAVIPAAGTTIVLTFSKSIQIGSAGASGVTFTLSGGAVTAAYISDSNAATLTYTLSRPILAGETGTISYVQPGNGIETVSGGVDVLSWTATVITNSSTQTILPVNTTLPSLSPSGNQASGTTHTWDRGNWTNGSTFDVTIRAGGAVILSVLATAAQTGTFDSTALQVGLIITIDVIAYNAAGLAHSTTPLAGSNTITVTGVAPSLVQVTPPAFTNPLELETPNTLVEATWNHTPDSIVHNFYVEGEIDPRRANNTGLSFTPHAAPHPDNLAAGDRMIMESVPTYLGTVFAKYRSVVQILTTAPIPVPVPPPPSPSPAPSPPPPPASTPVISLPYPVPSDLLPNSSPLYVDTVSVPIQGADGQNRIIKYYDPLGSPQYVYITRIVRADKVSSSLGDVNSEKVWKNQGFPINPTRDYWFAFAWLGKSSAGPVGGTTEWPVGYNGAGSDEEFTLFRILSQTLAAHSPDVSIRHKLSTSPGKAAYSIAWQATEDAATAGEILGDLGELNGSAGWSKYIVHVRPGYTTSHGPRLRIWSALNGALSFTLNLDSTHINTHNHTVNGASGEKSYAVIGLSHTKDTWNTAFPSIAGYATTLYYGEGVDHYAECVAALANLISPPPAPAPSPSPSPSPPPPSVSPLVALEYPVSANIDPNSSTTYDGVNPITAGGVVRQSRVLDPASSGKYVNLHRLKCSDANPSGNIAANSIRSEHIWLKADNNFRGYCQFGVDEWGAFGARMKGGEFPTVAVVPPAGFLIAQNHSGSSGDTQPPWSLNIDFQLMKMRWETSYNTQLCTPPTNPNYGYEGVTKQLTLDYPTVDTWYWWIYHRRPGVTQAHNPLFELWLAVNNGVFAKQTLTAPGAYNDYNYTNQDYPKLHSYPRIGLYLAAGYYVPPALSTIACYLTPHYYGQGVNLYNEAVEALRIFRS